MTMTMHMYIPRLLVYEIASFTEPLLCIKARLCHLANLHAKTVPVNWILNKSDELRRSHSLDRRTDGDNSIYPLFSLKRAGGANGSMSRCHTGVNILIIRRVLWPRQDKTAVKICHISKHRQIRSTVTAVLMQSRRQLIIASIIIIGGIAICRQR